MKIQSTKPESQSQLTDQDNTTSTTVPPLDFLFDLLTQLAKDTPTQPSTTPATGDASTNPNPDTNPNKINEFINMLMPILPTNPAPDPAPTSAPMLTSAMNNGKNAINPALNEKVDNKNESIMNAALTEQIKNDANSIQQNFSKNNELEVNAKTFKENEINANAKLTELSNEEHLAKFNNKQSVNNMLDTAKPTNGEENRLLLDAKEESLTKQFSNNNNHLPPAHVTFNDSQKFNQALTTAEAPEVATAASIDTAKMLAHPNKSMDSIPSNYKEAFNQLGHFINNQTIRNFSSLTPTTNQPDSAASSANSSASTPTYAQTDADLKIELLSSSLKAHGAEGYDAKIKIYPPELGHVVAKLKIENNNAQLVILTENNHVKEIVESNLSLLKQHLQGMDINLSSVEVKAQPQANESYDQRDNPPSHKEQLQRNEEFIDHKKSPKVSQKSTDTLIDTYA